VKQPNSRGLLGRQQPACQKAVGGQAAQLRWWPLGTPKPRLPEKRAQSPFDWDRRSGGKLEASPAAGQPNGYRHAHDAQIYFASVSSRHENRFVT